jgi:hypothetical protein
MRSDLAMKPIRDRMDEASFIRKDGWLTPLFLSSLHLLRE